MTITDIHERVVASHDLVEKPTLSEEDRCKLHHTLGTVEKYLQDLWTTMISIDRNLGETDVINHGADEMAEVIRDQIALGFDERGYFNK